MDGNVTGPNFAFKFFSDNLKDEIRTILKNQHFSDVGMEHLNIELSVQINRHFAMKHAIRSLEGDLKVVGHNLAVMKKMKSALADLTKYFEQLDNSNSTGSSILESNYFYFDRIANGIEPEKATDLSYKPDVGSTSFRYSMAIMTESLNRAQHRERMASPKKPGVKSNIPPEVLMGLTEVFSKWCPNLKISASSGSPYFKLISAICNEFFHVSDPKVTITKFAKKWNTRLNQTPLG